jgi:diguanylate cyclase (GGDEF)-like protein/PAS domain S-box-containing protein
MKENSTIQNNHNDEMTKNSTPLDSDSYLSMFNPPIVSKNEIVSSHGDTTENADYNLDSHYSYVLIIEGKNDHRIIYLEDYLYEIGRRNNAHITIQDKAVSRYHATIVKEFDKENFIFCYKILDGSLSGEKSRNGLVINNKRCKSKILEHGDLISFTNNIKARFFVIDKNSVNDNLFIDFENQDNSTNLEELEIDSKQTQIFSNASNAIPNGQAPTNDHEAKQSLTDYLGYTQTFAISDNSLNTDIFIQKDYIIEYISKLSSFAELSPYPIVEINLEGVLTYYNPSASMLFPDLQEEGINHPLLSRLLRADHKIQGNLFVREVNYKDKIFEQYIHYLPELKLIRSYIFDFTQRKHTESKLRDSEEKYRAVVEQISEGILLFNADDLQIIEANVSASKILNYSIEEITEQTIDFFLTDQYVDFSYKLNLFKESQYGFREELKFKVKDNHPIDVELSINIINYDNHLVFCGVFRDITIRKTLENELKYQAYYDNLTDLYQRNYFREFFEQTLRKHKIQNQESLLAVMFLDVDKFKQINDNYGHDIGDLLLKQFAQRLKHCVKSDDCLGRWGGDEFVVLLVNLDSIDQVISIAQRINQIMQRPFQCHTQTINTSTSIGIAIAPEHGSTVDSLMKNADKALYTTKANGRNGYTLYDDLSMIS